MKVLAVDIGGTKIKALATGQTEPRKAVSGRGLTPTRMVEIVRELADGWEFEALALGYPGLVGPGGPRSEPGNLGAGWVGFDYAAAFDHPVKIANDAAMQALGSYEGGRMLFLGLGTGLGSALIAENVIVPLELGRLPYRRNESLGDVLSRKGLKRIGKAAWKAVLTEVSSTFISAFEVDYVVLGGGNAKLLKENPPPGARMGHNLTAFRGGFRLWGLEGVPVIGSDHVEAVPTVAEWRLI
jgi:polyphosphate glucokinase